MKDVIIIKPTIKDVAKKANVSVSTVSRVINKKGYVHEETKVVVYKTIEELGFVPNQLARSLTSRSSKIIGVIVPHIGPNFYGRLLESIETQAGSYGYKIMFCHTQDNSDRELEYINFFEQYNIDGLIIASNFVNKDILSELKIPIVTVDHVLDETIPSITSDNVYGGMLGARKLLENNRKNILLFRGPSFLLTTMERTIGVINELKTTKIYADIYDFDLVHPDEKLIEEVLRKNKNVDAIFAYSDTLALVTIHILKKLGKRVPEDVDVIGYDDTPFCNWSSPSITTIRQNIDLLGKQALINLTRLIRGVELETLHEVLEVSLIARESTKST